MSFAHERGSAGHAPEGARRARGSEAVARVGAGREGSGRKGGARAREGGGWAGDGARRTPDTRGRKSAIVAGVGAALWLLGLFLNPRQALFSWLFAFAATLTIAWGGLALLMIGYLTRLRTLLAVREPCRRMAAALPAFALLVVPVLAGMATLYPWVPPVEGMTALDVEKLAAKAGYLDPTFFVARAILYLFVWIGAFALLRRAERWATGRATASRAEARDGAKVLADASLAPDTADRGVTAGAAFGRGGLLRRPGAMAAVGLIALAFTAAFAAIDWLMSLTPLWVSTVYPLYVLVGGVTAALALAMVRLRPGDVHDPEVAARASEDSPARRESAARHDAATRSRKPRGQARVDDRRGNLLLTLVLAWAYLGYSQYLIIWIADVPSEIPFYLVRTRGSWGGLAVLLLAGHLGLPFLLLLFRKLNRSRNVLAAIGGWLVVMHVLDVYWLVMPALHNDGLVLHWIDMAAILAVTGAAIAGAGGAGSAETLLARPEAATKWASR
jgi:hypothetical protein